MTQPQNHAIQHLLEFANYFPALSHKKSAGPTRLWSTRDFKSKLFLCPDTSTPPLTPPGSPLGALLVVDINEQLKEETEWLDFGSRLLSYLHQLQLYIPSIIELGLLLKIRKVDLNKARLSLRHVELIIPWITPNNKNYYVQCQQQSAGNSPTTVAVLDFVINKVFRRAVRLHFCPLLGHDRPEDISPRSSLQVWNVLNFPLVTPLAPGRTLPIQNLEPLDHRILWLSQPFRTSTDQFGLATYLGEPDHLTVDLSIANHLFPRTNKCTHGLKSTRSLPYVVPFHGSGSMQTQPNSSASPSQWEYAGFGSTSPSATAVHFSHDPSTDQSYAATYETSPGYRPPTPFPTESFPETGPFVHRYLDNNNHGEHPSVQAQPANVSTTLVDTGHNHASQDQFQRGHIAPTNHFRSLDFTATDSPPSPGPRHPLLSPAIEQPVAEPLPPSNGRPTDQPNNQSPDEDVSRNSTGPVRRSGRLRSVRMSTLSLFVSLLFFPLLSALTFRESTFVAYDCSRPENKTTVEAPGMQKCQVSTPIRQQNRTYLLLQAAKTTRLPAQSCQVIQSRFAWRDGVWDHLTFSPLMSSFYQPLEVTQKECAKMWKDKRYLDPEGKEHVLTENSTTMVQFHAAGNCKHGDDREDIDCTGGEYVYQNKKYYHMVVWIQLDITLRSEEVVASHQDYSVTVHRTQVILPCRTSNGGCIHPSAGTFLWDQYHPDLDCNLYKLRHTKGIDVIDEQGEVTYLSQDGSMVRLDKEEPISRCHHVVFRTQYPHLFLTEVLDSPHYNRPLHPSEMSTITYANQQDSFLFGELTAIIKQEYSAVRQHLCQQKLQHRRGAYAQAAAEQRMLKDGETVFLGEGWFALASGEVWYRYHCRALQVSAYNHESCFDSLPVRLAEPDLHRYLSDRSLTTADEE